MNPDNTHIMASFWNTFVGTKFNHSLLTNAIHSTLNMSACLARYANAEAKSELLAECIIFSGSEGIVSSVE